MKFPQWLHHLPLLFFSRGTRKENNKKTAEVAGVIIAIMLFVGVLGVDGYLFMVSRDSYIPTTPRTGGSQFIPEEDLQDAVALLARQREEFESLLSGVAVGETATSTRPAGE